MMEDDYNWSTKVFGFDILNNIIQRIDHCIRREVPDSFNDWTSVVEVVIVVQLVVTI